MQEKKMICTRCPRGCTVKAVLEDGVIVSIQGNHCKLGEAFARDELTDPKRTLTTTLKVQNGRQNVVSVKTDRPIPKTKIQEVIRALANVTVDAPVFIGDIIVEKVNGLESNIIATTTVMEETT